MNKAQTYLWALGEKFLFTDLDIEERTGITHENLSRIRHGTKSGARSADKLKALWDEEFARYKNRVAIRAQNQTALELYKQSRQVQPVRPQVVESQPFPSVRIQQLPPQVRQPSRLLPQTAASMQPYQAPPEVIQGPAIAYHAHYRPDTWPIGVPVQAPPELKTRLAWPRSPERWNQ